MQNVARIGRVVWTAVRTLVLVPLGRVSGWLRARGGGSAELLTRAERKQQRKQQVREAMAQRRSGRRAMAKAA